MLVIRHPSHVWPRPLNGSPIHNYCAGCGCAPDSYLATKRCGGEPRFDTPAAKRTRLSELLRETVR